MICATTLGKVGVISSFIMRFNQCIFISSSFLISWKDLLGKDFFFK